MVFMRQISVIITSNQWIFVGFTWAVCKPFSVRKHLIKTLSGIMQTYVGDSVSCKPMKMRQLQREKSVRITCWLWPWHGALGLLFNYLCDVMEHKDCYSTTNVMAWSIRIAIQQPM